MENVEGVYELILGAVTCQIPSCFLQATKWYPQQTYIRQTYVDQQINFLAICQKPIKSTLEGFKDQLILKRVLSIINKATYKSHWQRTFCKGINYNIMQTESEMR